MCDISLYSCCLPVLIRRCKWSIIAWIMKVAMIEGRGVLGINRSSERLRSCTESAPGTLCASSIQLQMIEGRAGVGESLQKQNGAGPVEQPLKGWSHELNESNTMAPDAESTWARSPSHASREKSALRIDCLL